MNRKYSLVTFVVALALLLSASGATAQGPGPQSSQATLGTAFTYQGQLKNGSGLVNGNCDFEFSLWDSLANLTGQIGTTQAIDDVAVNGGLFTVQLDFGAGAFTGDTRWLQIAVKCGSDTTFTSLTPRLSLTPVPYALALPGLWTQQNPTSPNVIGGYRDNTIAPGVYGAVIAGGGASGAINDVSGNYATIGGGRCNTAQGTDATVGGGWCNSAFGVQATVGGGRSNNAGYVATVSGGYQNYSGGDYAVVGGGARNAASGYASFIGGGGAFDPFGGAPTGNTASGQYATIAGGKSISATGNYAVIGGGQWNTASGENSFVGGGQDNLASGYYGVVGGGNHSVASGYAATVPGGDHNTAQGNYAFAAGRQAQAVHNGSFVWADATGANFASTADNQFAVRASGGVVFTSTLGSLLRLMPVSESPNVIGGSSVNTVSPNIYGATIAGGGGVRHSGEIGDYIGPNVVSDNYGTVSGGFYNRAGAYSFVGGGDTNTASGSYAIIGGGASNIASAYGATVGGGGSNTASGDHATIGGGEYNFASGTYATVPGGSGAVASHYGQMAYAAGRFYSNGDAQTSVYVLRRETTDALPQPLYLDGGSALLTIPSNRAMTFDILVVARSDANLSAGYEMHGVIENDNGTTKFVGTPTITTLGEDIGNWDATVQASDTYDALSVVVTGFPGQNIRWVATVRTAEVAW